MKISSNNSAERPNAGARTLPRCRTKHEHKALYRGLDQFGPDEVRDRLRNRLEPWPTKAALGALAQATLDLIAEELRTRLTESLEERQWAAKIPYSYIDALLTIACCASSEPDFKYELSCKKRLLDRERFTEVEGGYWTMRRGNLHRVRKFGPLSTDAFVRALMKTLACYPNEIGGYRLRMGSSARKRRTRSAWRS
jgi:hypothetical protein